MRADAPAIAALLLGTAALVAGTLFTFATTLLGNGAAVVTTAVLLVAIGAAVALGTLANRKRKTPYW